MFFLLLLLLFCLGIHSVNFLDLMLSVVLTIHDRDLPVIIYPIPALRLIVAHGIRSKTCVTCAFPDCHRFRDFLRCQIFYPYIIAWLNALVIDFSSKAHWNVAMANDLVFSECHPSGFYSLMTLLIETGAGRLD